MADVLNSAKELGSATRAISNDARQIVSAVAKTSVVRLTKDQVFQFPVFMDASISDDEQYPIIKCIEKNYANLIMIAITNNGVIDRDRYDDVNMFLRKFHNNKGIPLAMESVNVTEATLTEGRLSDRDIRAMESTIEDCLDMGCINDMYQPYKVTEAKLSRALEAALEQLSFNAALEADTKYFRRPLYKRKPDGTIEYKHGVPVIDTDNKGNILYQYMEAPADTNSHTYKDGVSDFGEPQTLTTWKQTDANAAANAKASAEWNSKKEERAYNEAQKLSERQYQERQKQAEREYQTTQKQADREYTEQKEKQKALLTAIGSNKGSMVNDTKYSNLSPTVLNMTMANIKKGVGAWSQNLIIGVKAVTRLIPQSLMINNMVEACKTRPIFTFIKWTNHELKFIDLLTGVNTYRDDAANSNGKWLRILRRRSRISKLPGAKLNPNTTIVITENDVHYVYENCGINLEDINNIKRIIDKYFLLGFAIYDTEGKMLKVIYDGESEFTMHSMRNLMSEVKKETDLLAMNRY